MAADVTPDLKVPVTSADHRIGPDDAVITLVEYGDYECPHCAIAYPEVKAVRGIFGDSLRFVFRNFPLRNVHPHAQHAAEIAEFAGAGGAFWRMHDCLFENQSYLNDAVLMELVEQAGLSSEAACKALEEGLFRARVRADFNGGRRSGVSGTPTFFINGVRYGGSPDRSGLETAIDLAIVMPR